MRLRKPESETDWWIARGGKRLSNHLSAFVSRMQPRVLRDGSASVSQFFTSRKASVQRL